MRVQILDPPAYTPPYDRALAAALARAGVEVELVTSRFLHGTVPEAEGYRVSESFYRLSARRGLGARGRLAVKAAEHLADLARYRAGRARAARHGEAPDIVHHQWFTFPLLDVKAMPSGPPQVATTHYILPPGAGRLATAQARSVLRRMDAVIAHTEHGARRLREEVGLDPERVHVIPHGAFDYLPKLPRRLPLPRELEEEPLGGAGGGGVGVAEDAAAGAERPAGRGRRPPVVLFFGLLRPYKGLEVLLEAFESVAGAELWIVGNPRMDVEPLREAARRSASPVRIAPRFVDDAEIPTLMERADVVVLPYLDVEQSGVLYTALAFGKPMVLTEVGGFPEVAERTGAALTVPPGDPTALTAALTLITGDSVLRRRLARASEAASSGPYTWDTAAARTLDLYRELLA